MLGLELNITLPSPLDCEVLAVPLGDVVTSEHRDKGGSIGAAGSRALLLYKPARYSYTSNYVSRGTYLRNETETTTCFAIRDRFIDISLVAVSSHPLETV